MNWAKEPTPRQLREILFYIDDQSMTLREFRKRLFRIEDQDTPIRPGFNVWRELGVEDWQSQENQ
jgi:hypothetical protein